MASCILATVWGFGTVLFLSVWSVSIAAAQSVEEAQHRFEAGRRAYVEGRFEQALVDWQQAYELSGRAQLLNNIAETYDRLHRDQEAMDTFRRFLNECAAPACEIPADTRTRVQNRIAALEARMRGEPPPEPDSDDGTVVAVSRDPGPGPWIAGGASIAVAAVGAILVGVAASDVEAIDNAPQDSRWSDYEERYGRTEAMSIAGFVMLGIGGAGLAASLFWLIAGPSLGGNAHLDVHVGPNVAALSLRGAL